jgi:hypothetical protein
MRRGWLLLIAVLVTSHSLLGTAVAEESTVTPGTPLTEEADAAGRARRQDTRQPTAASTPKASTRPKGEAKPKHEASRPEPRASEPATGRAAEPASSRRPHWPSGAVSEEGETSQESKARRRRVLDFALLLVAAALLLLVAHWLRHWLSSPRLRRLLGGAIAVLRIALFVFTILLGVQLIPTDSDWFWWATIATFVLVAWSIRDLFADLIAGIIMTAERRIKKGMWVSGKGFEGAVERRSLRATWLRDGEGHQLTVPNRAMVSAPIVYATGAEAEHEVIVRLQGYGDASRVRQALNDAVLSSPWVLAGAAPVVLRDPTDPVLWRVRTRLLEPRFAVHFSGELLERVEDILLDEGRAAAAIEHGQAKPQDLQDLSHGSDDS